MSITVADCLKLPALRDAKLVAGKTGLNRTVGAASVIEYPEVALLSSDLIVGNELLISALVHIKDDVAAQCLLLRHLHGMGEACLILYYTGIFIAELDARVLATADEIGFPLIVMPPDRFDFRYSDVLMEVIEAVVMDQRQQSYFVTDMVNRISQLAPQHQTMNVVLRMLSDRIRCTLLLADGEMKCRAASAYPISNHWDYDRALGELRDRPLPNGAPAEETLCEKRVLVWKCGVVSKSRRRFSLLAFDEEGTQSAENLHQAAEVVGLFLNVWNRDVNFEGTHALIRAVMSDQPAEKERLVKSMHLDIASVHTIWILQPERVNGQPVGSMQWSGCAQMLKLFLQEHHKLVVVDTFEKYIIALMDDSLFDDVSLSMAQEFSAQRAKEGIHLSGVVCQGVENTAEAREAYLLSEANLDVARRIYLEKQMFTLGEIRFVQSCRDILSRGELYVKQKMALLSKLGELPNQDELVKTLCVYLLDAERSNGKTGQLLYLHKNTVKYRIGKISATLKWDVAQMPETFELFQACALYRMLYGK